MMKKVLTGFICIVLSIFFPLNIYSESTIYANSSYSYGIFDIADLLSDSEESKLTSQAKSTAKSIGMNVAVVVIDDLVGKTEITYANDFYDDEFGPDTDGVLLLVNLDSGIDRISTSGKALNYYSDSTLELMYDEMQDAMSNYDIYNEARIFMEQCVKYYNAGIPDKHYVYDEITGEIISENDEGYNSTVILAGLFYGFVAAIICVVVVIRRYKFHAKTSATNYVCKDKTNFTLKTDNFIREYTTKTKIESNSSSGGGSGRSGGSSSHRSSSGGRHGGASRGR